MDIKLLNIKGMVIDQSLSFNNLLLKSKNKNHIIYLYIKNYLAAQRQGTHKTKEKSEVSRSNRKLYKQKGTGNARKGDANNPIFRGGGTIFGPKPRKYKFKLNKYVKRLSKVYILYNKIINKKILVIKELNFRKPKTNKLLNIINEIYKYTNKNKYLIITKDLDKNLYLSSRNLKNIDVKYIDIVNTYELLNCTYIILLENAINKLRDLIKIKTND